MHVLPAFAGSTYSFIVPKKQNSVKEIFGKYPPFALLAFWHFGNGILGYGMLSRMVLCPIWLYIHWYFDTSGFISTGILTQLAFCTTGILALVYCAVVFSPMALWPWHYDNGIMAMAFCPNGILAMALWPGTWV